jgi:hypothetical protein
MSQGAQTQYHSNIFFGIVKDRAYLDQPGGSCEAMQNYKLVMTPYTNMQEIVFVVCFAYSANFLNLCSWIMQINVGTYFNTTSVQTSCYSTPIFVKHVNLKYYGTHNQQ